MRMKHLGTALICVLLTGCALAPRVTTEVVRIKPDPTWMADCHEPIRAGETLGDYYDWAAALWISIQECNIRQAAEREFYNQK